MKELMRKPQWILWKRENKGGKPTKVPYDATGKKTGTSWKYRRAWVLYEQAQKAAGETGADGIGFVLPKGFFLLDVDHRTQDDPLVRELLTRFPSYAEVSVSGGGIHIIGKCDLFRIPTYEDKNGKLRLAPGYYTKNPHNGIELYIGGLTNRYATFSDMPIRDIPVGDCTDAVLLTLEKEMKADALAAPARAEESAPEMTAEEIESAAFDVVASLRRQKNGAKFTKLYDKGDISDYNSASEADLALCSIIAYRAGNNPPLIEAIFNASALCREKWQSRPDYRNDTIRKAIASCTGSFHPSVIDHPSFIVFTRKGEAVLDAPLLAKYIRETVPYILVRDDGKQGTMVFVYEDGCYRLYSKEMMLGVIKAPVAEYNETLITMNKINEVYSLLTTDLNYAAQEDLNADEDLINFRNGLLQVTPDKLTLFPHSPEIRSTIQIPCDWSGEDIPTPVFDRFMDTLTNGDPGVKQLLLEFIGACVSNVKGWRMKKALFLVGEGDCGKSVLKSLVERILGRGNYNGIDLQQIEARFGTGMIYGRRLAGSSDMSFMTMAELKTFKMITGGDSLFAEFKGQHGFEYTYNGLLWFCMNRPPKFGGDDGKWVYDRIMIVRCPNTIPKEKQDKNLGGKLYEEREGILYKAVRALQEVLRNGYRFSEPESVIAARQEYMKDNNTVIGFYEECMCECTGNQCSNMTSSQIYRAYRSWCSDNNNGYAKTAKEFRDILASHLGTTYARMTVHREDGTYYRNLMLNEETNEEYGFF